ncbi:MAG: segregation and condensation protein A [Fimbriiglobus sp.]
MPYTVDLDAFHGPLDLLLYLVKRDEVDVLDISITRLAEQFLDFLAMMKELDVELAGDFLVLAATLMEIKAKSLLPNLDIVERESDEPDPRRELVKQLLEYRRFKDAAQALEQQAERHSTRFPRIAPIEPETPSAPGVKPVELWDLVSAFARIMRETQAHATTTVQVDETPQHVYEERIRLAVEKHGRLPLRDLFTPPYHRLQFIGWFLAMLEVIKLGYVTLEQPVAYGEIYLLKATAAESKPSA